MEVPVTMQLSVPSAGTPRPYTAPEHPSSSDSSSHNNMSLIPDTRVFFPPRRPSVAPTSRAEAIPKTKGIYSHDPLLDHNPEELWRFLASHLQSPRMAVRIVGTHMKTSTSGNTTSSRTVTDFSIELDVSRYVNPQWSQIFTNPARTASRDAVPPPAPPTVRETLEEYACSKNTFKEFRLIKLVVWDFEDLTKALKEIVRSSGYQSTVTITFPKQGYKVVALASNQCSKAAHSEVVRALCAVSCLCLCPGLCLLFWAIARKRTKNRLVCEYGMASSGAVFLARNQGTIYNAVVRRLERVRVTAW